MPVTNENGTLLINRGLNLKQRQDYNEVFSKLASIKYGLFFTDVQEGLDLKTYHFQEVYLLRLMNNRNTDKKQD